jgi:hypothetical protein
LSNGKGEVSPVVAGIVIILVIAVVVVIYVYLMGRTKQPPGVLEPPTEPGTNVGEAPGNTQPGMPGSSGTTGGAHGPGGGGG